MSSRAMLESAVAVLIGAAAGALATRLPAAEFVEPAVIGVLGFLIGREAGAVAALLAVMAGAAAADVTRPELHAATLAGSILVGAGATALGVSTRRVARFDSDLTLFDAIPLTSILYDPTTLRVIHANTAAISHFGYSADEFRRMTLRDLVVPGEIERMHGYLQANAHKTIRQIRWTLRRRDGEVGEFEVISTPVTLFGQTLRLVIGIDLSNYLKLHGRLRRAIHDIREAKAQFLAVVGHELRTPLTAVMTATEALEGQSLSRSQRQLVEAIRRNVEGEARLVDDMIAFIRSERHGLRFDLSVVDVHAEIRNVIEMYRPEFDRRRQRVALELAADPPYALADAARLQQVLWNLARNASKFTPDEGEIRICTYLTPPGLANAPAPDPSSDAGPESSKMPLVPVPGDVEVTLQKPSAEPPTPSPTNGSLIVEISDNGVGIDPEELDRIFDPFAQGRTTRRLWNEGLGLGLAISRAIADAHGGKLKAQSEGANRGSTFRLELLRPAERQTPPEPPRGARPIGRLEILLVDDSQDIRLSLSRLLRQQDHRVTLASDVAGALDALNSKHFDLLISDLELPDGTGHDLLKAARNGHPHAMPAIALSGYDAAIDRKRSAQAGFALHLAKPIHTEQLNEAIRKALGSKG